MIYKLKDQKPGVDNHGSNMASLLKENDDTVRWGIIGAGAVCEVKSDPAFYK